jgi:hypothetical protein
LRIELDMPTVSQRVGLDAMARIPAILVILMMITLGACGVRGPLELSSGEPLREDNPSVLDFLI